MTEAFLTRQEAARLLGISVDTLDRYRQDREVGWIEGVHYFSLPNRGYRYNKELLVDWLANRHDPDTHLQAIEQFRASLPSSRGKRKR